MGTSASTSHPVSGKQAHAPLSERLANAKATGRLRLVKKEKFGEILASPDLKNLKALDLSSCDLVELPHPVGTHLIKLQQLKLNDNSTLRFLPSEIYELQNLRKLDCGGCTRLESLERLPASVETLTLSGCNFQGEVQHPTLSLSPNLVLLDLSGNPLLSGFGSAFGFEVLANKLVELNLSHNPNLEEIPEEIARVTKLLILKLDFCPKIKSLPAGLFAHTLVNRIELKGSGFTKASFMKLPKVELFMERRKARMDREIAGGVIAVDLSVCGLDDTV